MDNQILSSFNEIFGEVICLKNEHGSAEILSLQNNELRTIEVDSDILIGVKVSEFVNIKKQIEFESTPNQQGGLNKLKFFVRHFTRKQAKNLTFEPIKRKFDKFIELDNSFGEFLETTAKDLSFFKER